MRQTCRGVLPALMAGLLLLGASSAMAELRLAVSKTPLSLSLYVAEQKGFFTEQGLDVKLAPCEGGHRCLKEMLAGRADLATVGDLPLVLTSFERTDYAVIGTLATSSDDVKLIAHARSRISKPLHLTGKRVGAVAGSASHYFLELYLLTAGVDPQGVTVVALQPEQMLAALQNDQVDAVAIWEPHAYLSTKALGSSAVVLPNAGGYLLTFNLVAHRRLVGVRDEEMTRLLKAVERAVRFIQERPDEAKAILRTSLKLDQAFIDWGWGGMAYRLGLDQSLISTMEGEARWARREGHVKGAAPNFMGLLHSAPLKAVKPSAVGVNR